MNRPLPEVLDQHLKKWPQVAAAGVLTAQGRAVAGEGDKPFPWASVTKLLTAMSTWVAVEEGTLSWGTPAGPPGATVAHLLAHASGLPFDGAQPIAPPGRRRIYSNSGTEALGAALEVAAGMPFEEYLYGAVLGPLGMAATIFAGSPARGASGPVGDLMALAGELMAPTLVSRATWELVTSVAFPGLAGVLPSFGRQDPCDWGLGPEVRSHKSPHWTGKGNSPATFGHWGQSGSLLWVDPVAGVSLVSLSSQPFGPWAKESWPALADTVLAVAAP